jgi:hypothetical protein
MGRWKKPMLRLNARWIQAFAPTGLDRNNGNNDMDLRRYNFIFVQSGRFFLFGGAAGFGIYGPISCILLLVS